MDRTEPPLLALNEDLERGTAALTEGRYAEAEAVARALLDRDPNDVQSRALLGAALAYQGRPAEAVRLLAKSPDRLEFHLARAFALDRLGSLDEAERSARQAAALGPDRVDVLTTLGAVLADQGRYAEALSSFGRALAIDPVYAPARLGRGKLRLALGDYRAWSELDWRLNVPGLAPRFTPGGPAWDGSSPAGKTLLLVAEPGRSDQLMFVRFAAVLKRAGARVVLACRPEMAAVLGRAEGVDRVVTDPSELDADGGEPVDACADLLSLPALLGVGPSSVPRDPYLTAEPQRSARWASELAALGGYRVAVHWATERPDRRSIPLDAFAPLAEVPGVRLVSVQKGRGADDVCVARFPVADFGPRLDAGPDAFVDTAAVLAGSDLVVTNDGPIAHLAGALGVPVWIALPIGPDWRWLAERSDSPWYPSARLIRQRRQGDWSKPFRVIAETLRAGVAVREAVWEHQAG